MAEPREEASCQEQGIEEEAGEAPGWQQNNA